MTEAHFTFTMSARQVSIKYRSMCATLQAAIGLERFGLPSVPASLAVLVVALVLLDTFNNSVLGEGTLNNPVNSLGFAAVGKGTFAAHLLRIVRPPSLVHWSKCMFHCSVWSLPH